MPDAYWVPAKAGMEGVGPMLSENFPYVKVLANGKKYFIEDANPHAVCLIDGDNFLPVGNLDVFIPRDHPLPCLLYTSLSNCEQGFHLGPA